MAILTFSTAPQQNTEIMVSLNKSELYGLSPISGDAFWSNPNVVKDIFVYYESSQGRQTKILNFNAQVASPQVDLFFTLKSRSFFELYKIVLKDYDDGELVLDRAQLSSLLTISELDISFPSVPVTISTLAPSIVVEPISATAEFGESVTGFAANDFAVTNCTVSNIVGSGTTYTFDVTPLVAGTFSFYINANRAQNSSGSGNLTSNTITRTYSAAIGVTLSSTAPSTVSESFAVTATFDQSVTGFTVGDIAVVNGAASNLSGSGAVYTFYVTPFASGVVSAQVSAETVVAGGSLTNSASNTISRTYDGYISEGIDLAYNGDPFIVGSSVPANNNESFFGNLDYAYDAYAYVVAEKKAAPFIPESPATATISGNLYAQKSFDVYIAFTQPVTFTSSNLDIVNGSITSFSGSGTNYTATIQPTSLGNVTIQVEAGGAYNANGFVPASNILTVQYLQSDGDIADAEILGDFGFNNLDYALNAIPQGKNGNYSASSADYYPLTVALTSQTNATSGANVFANIVFSHPVTDFIGSDLNLTNATLTELTGSGQNYIAKLNPTTTGDVSLSISSAKATNQYGATNSASNTLSWAYITNSESYDGMPIDPYTSAFEDFVFDVNYNASPAGIENQDADILLRVLLTLSSASSTIVAGTFSVTATFDFPVTGFLIEEISASNATVANLSGSGSVYTFDVTPTVLNSAINVSVAAGVALGSNGNLNEASNVLTRVYSNSDSYQYVKFQALDSWQFLASSTTGNVIGLSDVTFTWAGANQNMSSIGATISYPFGPTGSGNLLNGTIETTNNTDLVYWDTVGIYRDLFIIDLKAQYPLDGILLGPQAGYNYPKTFKVYGSIDNSTWIEILAVSQTGTPQSNGWSTGSYKTFLF